MEKKKNSFKFILGTSIIILLIALYLIYSNAPQKEIRAVVLRPQNCSDCFNIAPILNEVRSSNVNLTIVQYFDVPSAEAEIYLDKYNITKLPAILLFGGTSNLQSFGEKRNDALVFTRQKPVYLDLQSGKFVGRVNATIINTPLCSICQNLSNIVAALRQQGMSVYENKINDIEAMRLIGLYNISKLPVLILSPDALQYELMDSWRAQGTIESDGSFVLRNITVPYWSVSEKKVKGSVNSILIKDATCANCYDPTTHQEVLQNQQSINLKIVSTKILDISSAEGKILISKYKITSVPTIIVQGDLSVYPTFLNIWPQIGTQEADGSYIFRNNYLLEGQYYRDLKTNQTLVGTGKV